MSNNIILILIVLGAIAGCKKVELPTATMTAPIFSVNATIDGIDKSLSAGTDDYYLFTDSYIDEFGTPVFYGQLGSLSDCPGACLESLTIEFRNSSSLVNLDENLITPGKKDFYSGLVDSNNIDLIQVTFENTSFSNHPVQYFWDFGNGQTSNLENPGTIIFENSDQSGADPVVTLTIVSSTGCTISTDQIIMADDPSIGSCSFQINSQANGPSGFQVCATDLSQLPVAVDWLFGDTTITAECFEIPEGVQNTITALVSSFTGCQDSVIIISQMDSITGEVSICQAGFIISSIESLDSMVDQQGLGTVNIKYTDANGLTFESGYVVNQFGNNFEIISSEDYELNEKGKETQQFEFKFSGKLANAVGDEIELQNVTGNWAIAIE